MATLALLLFAVAASVGLYMAGRHFAGKPQPPVAVGLLHGAVAATALVLLIIAVMGAAEAGLGGIAIGVFVAAALGGAVMMANHLRGRPWPSALVLAHGALAVTGFVLAILWVTGG
jgi:hypothetical protein